MRLARLALPAALLLAPAGFAAQPGLPAHPGTNLAAIPMPVPKPPLPALRGAPGAMPGGATPPAPLTARRAPGTDGSDVVIEPIPAAASPAAAPSGASDPRRAFLESGAAMRVGDDKAADESLRLIAVREKAGQTCRDYAQTVIVEELQVRAVGTVCKQKDGSWKLVDR
jgi:hypothetical protein